MGKIKTTKIEYQKRIYAIQGWIVEGIQSSLITRQILSNAWCTSQRHAERMLKAARDEWTKIPDAEMEQKRRLKIVELQQLKRSMKDQYRGTPSGIRALMSIDKEIILLEGMRKPTKVSLTDPDGKPVPTSGNKPDISITVISSSIPIEEKTNDLVE